MEVDGHQDHLEAGSSQVQIMDEEPESINLEGLDLLELERACRKK